MERWVKQVAVVTGASSGIGASIAEELVKRGHKKTNVMGLCIATREAIKQMKENKIDGHIIHINSIAGHKTHSTPLINVYPASKYAVTALAESLSISPGVVDTKCYKDFVESLLELPVNHKNVPQLNPEDVADAVVYALSTPSHVNVSEVTVQAVGESF